MLRPHSLSDSLRSAARLYLDNAIRLYLKIEGKVSIFNQENLGDSANIICSINRSAEHLLKLKLALTDTILLYPLPKKVEEYLRLKSVDAISEKHHVKLGNTIGFKEALERVRLLSGSEKFDFSVFTEINSLRNSIEHHWDHNEKFLQKNIGIMSTKIIPSFRDFIQTVLNEDFSDYNYEHLLEDMERLDRAIINGHSLTTQRRLEQHRKIYSDNPKSIRGLPEKPNQYVKLDEEEVNVQCPICSENFTALWDFEVDYDENGPVAAFPDAKCLYCHNCRFYIDGRDIATYLPEELYEYFKDEDWSIDPY